MVTQVAGHYADLYAWENLHQAYRNAAKGKRGRAPAANVEFCWKNNLIHLQEELANESYHLSNHVGNVQGSE